MGTLSLIDSNYKEPTAEELKALAEDFALQAKAALQGDESTLSMFPAYVKQGEIGGNDMTILSIDIGGSRIRGQRFQLVDSVLTNVTAPIESQFPGGSMSMEEYATTLTDVIAEVGEGHDHSVISLVYSFPATIIKDNGNIDADRTGLGTEWGKGFVVSDSEVNISAYLRESFVQRGIAANRWVTLNDVASLMLAQEGANASFIAGTGYNIGITDNEGNVFNSEAGFYDSELFSKHQSGIVKAYKDQIEKKLLALDVDPKSNIQLRKPSELEVGGKYLYQLLIMGLCMVGDCDQSTIEVIHSLESSSLSHAINENWEVFEKDVTMPSHRREHIKEISVFLRDRAADVVAFQLAGAAFMKGGESEPKVAADGTVIHRLPGMVERIQERYHQITGTEVAIELVTTSGLLGAARAAVLTAR